MKIDIEISVDTNDYDGDEEFSLFGLQSKTFQEWRVAGQTGYWQVEGEVFCGTRYSCVVDYDDQLLLWALATKIKEVCGARFINIRVNDELIKFTDDGLMVIPQK